MDTIRAPAPKNRPFNLAFPLCRALKFSMQLEEMINFAVSSSLFAYLLFLLRHRRDMIPRAWIAGMILVLVTQIVTILEHLIWFEGFNTVEHLSMSLAAVLFFAGSFHYGKESLP